jgi:hypothetical protein
MNAAPSAISSRSLAVPLAVAERARELRALRASSRSGVFAARAALWGRLAVDLCSQAPADEASRLAQAAGLAALPAFARSLVHEESQAVEGALSSRVPQGAAAANVSGAAPALLSALGSLGGSLGGSGSKSDPALAALAAAAAAQAASAAPPFDEEALRALGSWLGELGLANLQALPEVAAKELAAAPSAEPQGQGSLGRRLASVREASAELELLADGAAGGPGRLDEAAVADWPALARKAQALAVSLRTIPAARDALLPEFGALFGALAQLASVSARSPALARALAAPVAPWAARACKAAEAYLAQDSEDRGLPETVALARKQIGAIAAPALFCAQSLREAFPRASEGLRSKAAPAARADLGLGVGEAGAREGDKPESKTATTGDDGASRVPAQPRPVLIREVGMSLGPAPAVPTAPVSAPAASVGAWGDGAALWAQTAREQAEREIEAGERDWARRMALDPQAWKGKGFGVLAWADAQDDLARDNQIAEWAPFGVFLLSGMLFGAGLFTAVFSGLCFWRPARRSFSSLGRAFVALRSVSEADRKTLTSTASWRSFLRRMVGTALMVFVLNGASCALSAAISHMFAGAGLGSVSSLLGGGDSGSKGSASQLQSILSQLGGQ